MQKSHLAKIIRRSQAMISTMKGVSLTFLVVVFSMNCSSYRNFSNTKLSHRIEIHIQEPFTNDQLRIKVNNVLIFAGEVSTDLTGHSKTIFTEVPAGKNKISVLMNNKAFAEETFEARDRLYICIRRYVDGSNVDIKIDCSPAYL